MSLVGRIIESLADGEWHWQEEVVKACYKHVPPESAFRRYNNDVGNPKEADLNMVIFRGSRRAVCARLYDLCSQKRIEAVRDERGCKYRLVQRSGQDDGTGSV